MGKPRDTKIAILPSTTRKGTTLSTSAALDSPSVIDKLVSPPHASRAGTSAESENSHNIDNVSAVLDDSGSLGSFLDATIAKSRQIENTETPNENVATPVNSPESVEYSSDDLDEDYVELDDDFIEKCNATTDARKIKKLLAEHAVRYKLSPDPKFATSPINIRDKDYDFSLDLSHIAIVEKTPFCGTEKESAVEHMTELSTLSGLFSDDIKMRTYFVAKIFPFSLKDDAKTWYNNLSPGSIKSPKELLDVFFRKYFPASAQHAALQRIYNFDQEDGEKLPEAWARFCSLIRAQPDHDLEKHDLLDIFYSGLTIESRAYLDSCAGCVFRKRTPDDAEELLAKIGRNHDDWSTPEPTPTPIVKKRGMIKLNDEDMREAKKSLKEKGIKPEDVKNLPPIEDICETIPPSSMIEDPLYPEGHPKRVEQDSQPIKTSAPSKKKKKKHKNVVESSEPVNDPNSISISDAETESGNEHEEDNDKNDTPDKEEIEKEPEKPAKNKKNLANTVELGMTRAAAGSLDDIKPPGRAPMRVAGVPPDLYLEQDGPAPLQADGSPFEFLPPAPVVLFCQRSPPLKKVIMEGQPISPKSAPKNKASLESVAPRASTRARTAVRKVAVRKTLPRKTPAPANSQTSTEENSSEGEQSSPRASYPRGTDRSTTQSQTDSPTPASRKRSTPEPAALQSSVQTRSRIKRRCVQRARTGPEASSPSQEVSKVNETSSGVVEEVPMPPTAPGPSNSPRVEDQSSDQHTTKPIVTSSASLPFLGEGCDPSSLLTFDPDSIEPAAPKIGEEPNLGAVDGPLQRLRVLLSSSVDALVEDPETIRGILVDIQPRLPVVLVAKLWPTVTLSVFKSRVQSARQRINLRRAQLPLRADIAEKCQRLNEKKAALDAKTAASTHSARLETLRKELEDLERRARETRQLIQDEESIIARSQEEAQGLTADLKTDLAEIRALSSQLVMGRDEDDEVEIAEGKMKKFKFGELFKKATTSTGRPSRASTQIRRSYNEDVIAPSFAPEEDHGAPNASSFPCYEFLTNAGLLDDFFTLVNRAGLATYVGDERGQYYRLTKVFVESFKFHNTEYEPTVAFKIYDIPVTMKLEEFCFALGIAPVGTARRIDDNPRDLLELYRGITGDDCRTIQRGKIRNIQLPAIKYFAYYIGTSILGRENTSNISSYHLAFLNVALTGETPYHLGSLIARRLSSRGPIFGGTIASRILTHLDIPLDSNDVPLTPRKLDIAAMKSHHFVTTNSTIDNIVYKMLFADGNEKEIPLPQQGLFNIDRQSWSLTKEVVEEHMKIQEFHQQHDSENVEPSYDYTVTYPDVSSSTYMEPGRSSSYYEDTTSWGPWE
ncbi:hypothetical protein QYE76_014674 [Lolium multiflorum]|uniref:Retrotransposon gag domain-containing protein n=1 Tax=Lolium multiflorum TaxID=4521 RepID=A0AAD8U596_LOLMU|nr:hypothetical protein QYE76_014674 [Lolium multiflorum]